MAPAPTSERPILGLSIGVMGCCTAAVGYTLQKIAHIKTARAISSAPLLRHTYWTRWEFIVGCILLVLASASATVTFTMVSASELAPLGAVTLVVQEFLSFWWLEESFTRVDGVAVLLMTVGTSLAVGNAKSSNQHMSLETIVGLFLRPVTIVSVLVISIVVLVLSSFVAAVGSSHNLGLSTSTTGLDALSRSVIAGLLGGCTTTLGKAAATILFLPLFRQDWTALVRIEPWICAAALILVTTYQMRYLNSGLGRYDSLRIIPYYQSTLTLSNLFSGMIIWDEIAVQTSTSLLFFAFGCATTVCGQLVLLTKVHSATEELIDASATVPWENVDETKEEDVDAEVHSSPDLETPDDLQPELDSVETSCPEQILIRRGELSANAVPVPTGSYTSTLSVPVSRVRAQSSPDNSVLDLLSTMPWSRWGDTAGLTRECSSSSLVPPRDRSEAQSARGDCRSTNNVAKGNSST